MKLWWWFFWLLLSRNAKKPEFDFPKMGETCIYSKVFGLYSSSHQVSLYKKGTAKVKLPFLQGQLLRQKSTRMQMIMTISWTNLATSKRVTTRKKTLTPPPNLWALPWIKFHPLTIKILLRRRTSQRTKAPATRQRHLVTKRNATRSDKRAGKQESPPTKTT